MPYINPIWASSVCIVAFWNWKNFVWYSVYLPVYFISGKESSLITYFDVCRVGDNKFQIGETNLQLSYEVWFKKRFYRVYEYVYYIQDLRGGAKRPPPTRFLSVTSTKVEFSPQNFLTFSFKPVTTLV